MLPDNFITLHPIIENRKSNYTMEKKMYPLRFIPVASRRPWGGHDLMKKLGKSFVECDEEGNEVPVSALGKIYGFSRFAIYRKIASASNKFREELRKEDYHE